MDKLFDCYAILLNAAVHELAPFEMWTRNIPEFLRSVSNGRLWYFRFFFHVPFEFQRSTAVIAVEHGKHFMHRSVQPHIISSDPMRRHMGIVHLVAHIRVFYGRLCHFAVGHFTLAPMYVLCYVSEILKNHHNAKAKERRREKNKCLKWKFVNFQSYVTVSVSLSFFSATFCHFFSSTIITLHRLRQHCDTICHPVRLVFLLFRWHTCAHGTRAFAFKVARTRWSDERERRIWQWIRRERCTQGAYHWTQYRLNGEELWLQQNCTRTRAKMTQLRGLSKSWDKFTQFWQYNLLWFPPGIKPIDIGRFNTCSASEWNCWRNDVIQSVIVSSTITWMLLPTQCKYCLRARSTSHAFCDDDSMHAFIYRGRHRSNARTCCTANSSFEYNFNTSHWFPDWYRWRAGRRFISRMTLSISLFTRMWLTNMKLYWLST